MSILLSIRNILSSSELVAGRLVLFTSQCLCHEKTEPRGCVKHRRCLLPGFIRMQVTGWKVFGVAEGCTAIQRDLDWKNWLTGIPWSLTKRSAKSCTRGTITTYPATGWGLSAEKNWGSSSWTSAGKGSQHYPGLCLEESCQQVQGGVFSPWLSLMETTSRVLCLVLDSLVEERRGLEVCLQKRTTKTVMHLEAGKAGERAGIM